MNRKLVALLVAIMLVATSIPAFADTFTGDANKAAIDAFVTELNEGEGRELVSYSIVSGGLMLVWETYVWEADYTIHYSESTGKVIDPKESTADEYAKYLKGEYEQYTEYLNVDDTINGDMGELSGKYDWATAIELSKTQYVAKNKSTGKWELVNLTAEVDKNVAGTNVVKTGPDYYDHHYTNYGTTNIIENVSFCPDKDSFGDGLNFSHDVAKTLFTVKARATAKLYITIKDDQGRLYPITNGSWNAPKNAYEVAIEKGETISVKWYGRDGMGYHEEGKLGDAKTIELSVIIKAESFWKDTFGQDYAAYDTAEIRFDYVVQHGMANHAAAAANGTASAPKTGDVRMAYVTLASLIVMAGVAVIITRKLRTNA